MTNLLFGRRRALRFIVAAAALSIGSGFASATAMAAQSVLPDGGQIIISGAAGQLGSEVTKLLLERGVPPQELILLTRTPDKLKDFAARGAIVRHGDFNDAESLPAAFAGGRTLLLISTDSPGPQRVLLHRAAIDAAKKAGVRRIVYTSVVDVGDHSPEDMFADHLKTEQALRDSGLAWTILRNQIYTDMQLNAMAQALKSGGFVTNMGHGKVAYITRHDCAAAAAAVLTTRGHDNKLYNVTGPELLGATDIAKILSGIAAKPVKAVIVDDATFVKGLEQGGMPAVYAQMSALPGVATRRGSAAIKTTAVAKLTGMQPMSLKDFLLAHRDQLAQ